ncbi:hypothetical protein CALVIDRAFT_536276 [Calocera viscosa TUFC12733]|uniref:GPN-loop GTPase n=1 Tax=Calocera viscosa (strain TUFC12733) TaxID=1330018 RepID=A0A167N1D3_CALVF|nr:hypothetical protein CALVIDRAFT_536276 [Calocera viscosa TUFC12733]
MSDPTPSTSSAAAEAAKKPTVIITIGMAGSGKTTFVQRLNSYLNTPGVMPSSSPPLAPPDQEVAETAPAEPKGKGKERERRPPYIINLDPAVAHMPYEANVDIRDTVDYKEVMKQYNLGPNGGILTALNLFTTKFDQVLGLMEKRAEEVDYIVLDTPGQIEIFTWSASGAIITDAVAASFPTIVAYIIDTPRTTAPATFMSNMLYACSILYKTRLPFLLVFNKTDVRKHEFAIEWMRDFEAYQAALASGGAQEEEGGGEFEDRGGRGEATYMNSLMNSMSLVLDEFYKHLNAVGVSSLTGDGVDDFFSAVSRAREEYMADYLPELTRLQDEKASKEQARQEGNMDKVMADLSLDAGAGRRRMRWAEEEDDVPIEEDEDEDPGDEEDEDEGEEIDLSRRGTADGIMDRARAAGGLNTGPASNWARPG